MSLPPLYFKPAALSAAMLSLFSAAQVMNASGSSLAACEMSRHAVSASALFSAVKGEASAGGGFFATAFATQDPWVTFQVGLAASVGAGISMGFTEAASDDGVISGRGSPVKRGIAAGVMTTLGGLGHALPYLIPDFVTATVIALAVVFVELWAIAWIQNRWMETPFLRAAMQVVLGGALVLGAGVLIGEI